MRIKILIVILGLLLGPTIEVRAQKTSAVDRLNALKMKRRNEKNASKAGRAAAGSGGGFAALRRGGGNARRGGALRQRATGAYQNLTGQTPKVRALVGERVYDALTGELLDDARFVLIEESETSKYYDDGTNGDLTPEDGIYARVTIRNDAVGPENQRIKERLIQAIYEANRLDPVQFYGYSLMAQDHRVRPRRSKRWKVVRGGKNGAGLRLTETAADRPVQVANYWDESIKKDERIGGEDGWAEKFLSDYRVDKSDLRSDFHSVYIPHPPTMPTIQPPGEDNWSPFTGKAATEEGDSASIRARGTSGSSGPLPPGSTGPSKYTDFRL